MLRRRIYILTNWCLPKRRKIFKWSEERHRAQFIFFLNDATAAQRVYVCIRVWISVAIFHIFVIFSAFPRLHIIRLERRRFVLRPYSLMYVRSSKRFYFIKSFIIFIFLLIVIPQLPFFSLHCALDKHWKLCACHSRIYWSENGPLTQMVITCTIPNCWRALDAASRARRSLSYVHTRKRRPPKRRERKL